MGASYSIRQLVAEFGVTARTLRHYEEVGLLQPGRKGSSRVYSGRDRARLKVVLRGRRLGFTLEEIREWFMLYDRSRGGSRELEAFAAKLERQRAALEQQRADLDAMLAEIRFFAGLCERMLQSSAAGHAER